MEKRKQFTFYRSYLDATVRLSPRRRWKYLESIVLYALDGVYPERLDPLDEALFLLTKPTLDAGRRMAAGGAKGKGKVGERLEEGSPKEGEIEIEKELETEVETETEGECQRGAGGRGVGVGEIAFEDFWDAYPVHIGKGDALAAWAELKEERSAILSGLRRWKVCQQWRKENGRYVPRAEKFLRQRWFAQEPGGVPMGASGELGQAEIEAIERMMREVTDV